MAYPKPEEFDDANPWRETRSMHPADIRLRRHGYRIHARAKGQEPVWADMHGDLIGQAAAMAELEKAGKP